MSKQKVTIASRIASDAVERSILVIRGQKVLVDEQLAAFYNVPTKALGQTQSRAVFTRLHVSVVEGGVGGVYVERQRHDRW
jgi:hypothetical protein